MAAALAEVHDKEYEAQQARRAAASTFDRLVDANLELVTAVRRQVFAIYLVLAVNTITVMSMAWAIFTRR